MVLQIAELLKCMLCHTGGLGSRPDTFDDIDTEKTVHIPKLLHCSNIHITWSSNDFCPHWFHFVSDVTPHFKFQNLKVHEWDRSKFSKLFNKHSHCFCFQLIFSTYCCHVSKLDCYVLLFRSQLFFPFMKCLNT